MYAFTFSRPAVSRYGSCIQLSPFTIQDSPTPFSIQQFINTLHGQQA
jgi:hypothetical protein